MAQTRDIKYINREFDDFRDQLVEFSKSYFPDTYNDFSPTSPGMMFMEMAAYIGDILAFYQDTQLQETFLTHAKDPKNLFNLAYMMGYRPRVTGIAETEITITQIVDAVDLGGGDYVPKWSDAAKINAQATLNSSDSSNTKFYIPKPIDFTFSSSYDPTVVTIETIAGGNTPSKFNLIKKAKAISGEIKTEEFTISSTPQKFNTLTLSDSNIVQVLSIVDAEGYEYHEVPFLGQDTVLLDEANVASDVDSVPYALALKKVPRRFVTRFRANGNLDIQFGAGTIEQDDSTIVPDATNVGNATNAVSTLDKSYDPTNFTYSKAYGIAPDQGSTITVTYLKGGGVSANVPANTLTSATATTTPSDANLSYTNELAATGGRDGDTIEELRENSLRAFNEQNRAVTLQDYTVRALSLPSQYGSMAKVYVIQDQLTNTDNTDSIVDNNPLALSLYVLAYDNNSNLVPATSTLKNNLKIYLQNYMILSDSINIKDAFVVNIGVKYEILTRPSYASRDVLLNCNNELAEYFKVSKRNINQPINLSEISTLLDKVKGVQTVQKIEITNKQGGDYSVYAYDVKSATRDNIVYPSHDPCFFEVKFPNVDIEGRVINI